MNRFLVSLITRSLGESDVLRPRPQSRFEQPVEDIGPPRHDVDPEVDEANEDLRWLRSIEAPRPSPRAQPNLEDVRRQHARTQRPAEDIQSRAPSSQGEDSKAPPSSDQPLAPTERGDLERGGPDIHLLPSRRLPIEQKAKGEVEPNSAEILPEIDLSVPRGRNVHPRPDPPIEESRSREATEGDGPEQPSKAQATVSARTSRGRSTPEPTTGMTEADSAGERARESANRLNGASSSTPPPFESPLSPRFPGPDLTRESPDSPSDTITVRIGRVEVKGAAPPPQIPATRPRPNRPMMSLEDYLNERGGVRK